MDRLDGIEMQMYLQQQQQMNEIQQQQWQNLYLDNLRIPYTAPSRELAISSASFMNISLSEFLRRDEIGNKTCNKEYGGKYKLGASERMTCYHSIMLQVSEQEVIRRAKNDEKYCGQLSGDRAIKCSKDYFVLGKRNILGAAW